MDCGCRDRRVSRLFLLCFCLLLCASCRSKSTPVCPDSHLLPFLIPYLLSTLSHFPLLLFPSLFSSLPFISPLPFHSFVFDREPDSAIAGWRKVGWSEEMRAVYAGDDLKNLYKYVVDMPDGREVANSHDVFFLLLSIYSLSFSVSFISAYSPLYLLYFQVLIRSGAYRQQRRLQHALRSHVVTCQG